MFAKPDTSIAPLFHKRNKRCAVQGCVLYKAKNVWMHSFPSNEKRKELFMAWLEATKNPFLQVMDHSIIHQRKHICSAHFDKIDYVRPGSHFLNYNAKPRFFLPLSAETPIKLHPNTQECPICSQPIIKEELEAHVNKCLFLRSSPESVKPSKITLDEKPEEVFSSDHDSMAGSINLDDDSLLEDIVAKVKNESCEVNEVIEKSIIDVIGSNGTNSTEMPKNNEEANPHNSDQNETVNSDKQCDEGVNPSLFMHSYSQPAMKRQRSSSPILSSGTPINTSLNLVSKKVKLNPKTSVEVVASNSGDLKSFLNTFVKDLNKDQSKTTFPNNSKIYIRKKTSTPMKKNEDFANLDNLEDTFLSDNDHKLNVPSVECTFANNPTALIKPSSFIKYPPTQSFRQNEEKDILIIMKNKPEQALKIDKNKKQKREEKKKNTILKFNIPLAQMAKPQTLDEFRGQNHILYGNSQLRDMLSTKILMNMIFWGPPGCGKTSLANIFKHMAENVKHKIQYKSLNANDAGVEDIRKLIALAKQLKKMGKSLVLFMDEIHRFNRKQQDVFLESVENGTLILIGATTENPSFCINNALLSRCVVYKLKPLSTDEISSILTKTLLKLDIMVVETDNNTLDPDLSSMQESRPVISKSVLDWLAEVCNGDARIALNTLQTIIETNKDYTEVISKEKVQDQITNSTMLFYDKKGEEHYNNISALHKSIRKSDRDAAIYWTTRMIMSGEDPKYIARRMIRAASEDIGNADPQALQLALNTMKAVEIMGMPEADVVLVQCAIYLAEAPKSRMAQIALDKAKYIISKSKTQPPVPAHLTNIGKNLLDRLDDGNYDRSSCLPPGIDKFNFNEPAPSNT